MRCLKSLADHTDYPHEILLVDNASFDESVQIAKEAFPQIKVIRSEENLGYAGGCNLGMEAAEGSWLLLLNNDAMVTAGWLSELMKFALTHPNYAALQPKIVSIDRDGWFDYAGAAGGKMDVFGFPFSRGRIFFTIEKDENQYDTTSELFWASGTCTLVKRDAVEITGMFDSDFFAHMEEIDLDWRFHLAGFKIGSVPGSVVKHSAGSTLAQESPRKVFLNHRNNLEMLLKNYGTLSLVLYFPPRIVFEFLAILFALAKLDIKQAMAILKALIAVTFKLRKIIQKRKSVQKIRQVSDKTIRQKMFKSSVVWHYFGRGKKTYSSLNCD